MLFAVEGGGFFSASALGYSKGLALLLLGQSGEDQPTRVSPWGHYHLVDQRPPRPKPQAERRKQQPAPRGCASFVCFGSRSRDSPGPSGSSSDRERVRNSDSADESDAKTFLKSSLKKSSSVNCSVSVESSGDDGRDSSEVRRSLSCTDRRKIHWTDAHGKELAEIREFEPSERGATDDELDHDDARRCQCVIQ